MRVSKFSLFLSIYIVISSYFMTQVWATWKAIFGLNCLILFFILLCLITIAAILGQSLKSKNNPRRIGLICVICLLGFIFALRQPYLSEKAHVLEFGLLGWVVMRDLTKKEKNFLKAALMAFVFVTVTGCLEEGFQKLLPWRVCEIRDMLTDAVSGLLGITLKFLS